ncbi:MAG: hypothetical protein QM703_03940 [Gemmatales bacterium]
MKKTNVGDPLEGAPEPTMSAPATPKPGAVKKRGKRKRSDASDAAGDTLFD